MRKVNYKSYKHCEVCGSVLGARTKGNRCNIYYSYKLSRRKNFKKEIEKQKEQFFAQ